MGNESELAYAGERTTERGSYDVLLDPVHGSAMPQGHTVYFIPDNLEEFDEPAPAVDAAPEQADPEPAPLPDTAEAPVPTPEPELPAWMLTTGWTPPQPTVDDPVLPPAPEAPVAETAADTIETAQAEPTPAAPQPPPVIDQPAVVEEPTVETTLRPAEPLPEMRGPRRSQHRKPAPAPTRPPPPVVDTAPATLPDPVHRSKHAQPPVSTARRTGGKVRIAVLGVLVVVIAGVFAVTQLSDEPEAVDTRTSSSSDGSSATTVPTVPVPLSNPDLTGSVAYNDGSTLVIIQVGLNEMTVETNASTQVVGGAESVPELVVGQEIKVQGIRTVAGTYLAQTITVQQ